MDFDYKKVLLAAVPGVGVYLAIQYMDGKSLTSPEWMPLLTAVGTMVVYDMYLKDTVSSTLEGFIPSAKDSSVVSTTGESVL